MIDDDVQILIEKAARGELGEAELAALNGRAERDPAVSDALSRAQEEYETMSMLPEVVLRPDDLPAIREAIKARAVTERRSAIAWMATLPTLGVVFAGLSLLGIDEPTLADVRRAAWFALMIGGGGSVAVWSWWRWYRARAAGAARGDIRTTTDWVRNCARGAHRESYLNLLGVLVVVVIVPINIVMALMDSDWGGVAFWIGFCVLIWLIGFVLARIEERHGT